MRRMRNPGLALMVGATALFASGTALARRGRVRFGLYFGIPALGAPYYAPTIDVPASSSTYVEQPTAEAVPVQPQQGWWYYCAEKKALSPVREWPCRSLAARCVRAASAVRIKRP